MFVDSNARSKRILFRCARLKPIPVGGATHSRGFFCTRSLGKITNYFAKVSQELVSLTSEEKFLIRKVIQISQVVSCTTLRVNSVNGRIFLSLK